MNINSISVFIYFFQQDNPALVTCLQEKMHGLEDGDHVTFKEVNGMTEINDKTFSISGKNLFILRLFIIIQNNK